ncbi:MAG: PQQ-binding-like beta-propeller repeat protein [Acidobacteriota bacterium]
MKLHLENLRWRSLVPCAALAFCLSAAQASDWPSFRGPGAQGVAPQAMPVEFDVASGKGVLWKTEVPGLAHSSPIIVGNKIFLTTAVRNDGDQSLKVGLYGAIAPVNDDSSYQFRVLAYDLASGKELWNQIAHEGVPKVKRHTKASHANSSPASDGNTVVAMFGSEGLYAYTMDGELKWKKDLGVLDSGFFQVPGAQWGFASSPVIHDGKVIIQADVQKDSFLAAFDVETGDELWRTPREEVPTWGTPAIAPRGDGHQIVVNGWKHIGGYSLDGEELWRFAGGGDIPVPTPIVAGNVVLITNAHGGKAPIYAVRLDAEGALDEKPEAFAWQHERMGNYMQTPIVVGPIAYFCNDRGVLSAFDLETGDRLYQQRLGQGQSGFSGSPVAAGGNLYLTSEDGEVYVVRGGREYELLAINELDEVFMSTPAIAEDRLLFRARKHLIAIGEGQ